MALITANKLTMSYSQNLLFSEASFEIGENDKIGFIGKNGSGKTSLFRIFAKEEDGFEGSILLSKDLNIGYVQQHSCADISKTAYEEILSVFDETIFIETELEKIHTLLEDPNIKNREDLIHKQAELNDTFQRLDGLTYKSRASSALIGLGFTQEETEMSVGLLSGGQRTKISLGKLLLSDNNLLLLDEPTNHLDIKSVEWLEGFLQKQNKSYIIISHDRYFLDRVTDKTMEIDNKKLTLCKGNYSAYIKLKEEILESQKKHFENTQKEIQRIEGIIEQQKRFNRERNYITIASKQKQIDKLKATLNAPAKEHKAIKLSFSPKCVSGNDVIYAEGLSVAFGEKVLFQDVRIDIKRGEKIFIIGPNGCGKTTLLRVIMKKLIPDSGYCRFGANVQIGYYDQNQTGLISEKTVIQEIYDRMPAYSIPELRKHLAAFMFRGDEIEKRMDELSGGERARIALLEILLKKPNFLILDEPTNHLDIASREVLEAALDNYEGTILSVSHDRYFVNRLSTKILTFSGTEVCEFEGSYEEYIRSLDTDLQSNVKTEKKVSEYQLRKERESNERKRLSRISRIEEDLEKLCLEKEELQNLLLLPDNASDYEKVLAITENLNALCEKEEILLSEYIELS